jgi:hypothetical protein
LDPEEWSCSDLRQALKNVRLLLEAGIELSDIKPANFISMVGASSSNDGGEDTRVMAIDLEDSFLVVSGESQQFELPRWMLRGSSSQINKNNIFKSYILHPASWEIANLIVLCFCLCCLSIV